MDNDNVVIDLTKQQRDLLVKYRKHLYDNGLKKLVSITVQTEDGYQICLTEDQLDSLLNCICEWCDMNESSGEDLDELGALLGYLEGLLQDDCDLSENTGKVCVLKVSLDEEDKLWRKIAIREGHTLNYLHDMIFEAFDRYDDHMYSFYFPHKPQKKLNVRTIYKNSTQYVHPYYYEDGGSYRDDFFNAAETKIGDLNLKEKQIFFYLFDFGDEWWHEIKVEQIGLEPEDDDYPRIIASMGESPEQYGCMDDYDDEDYDEDDDDI